MKAYKILLITNVLVGFSVTCSGQIAELKCNLSDPHIDIGTSLHCIQGVHIPSSPINQESSSYTIRKGFKFLTVTFANERLNEVILGYTGFHDFDGFPQDKYGGFKTDSFNLCDLKQSGAYYITVLEKDIRSDGFIEDLVINEEFSCDGGSIEIFSRRLNIYNQQSFLPFKVYLGLKSQSKEDNREYISEFGIKDMLKKAVITSERAFFYHEPNENTRRRAYVIKGDEVIMDVFDENWVKVAYEGEKVTTQGWLKRRDLDFFE